MAIELGNYAVLTTPTIMQETPKDDFVIALKATFGKVCPHLPDDGQIKAWKDCYDVLTGVFSSLPESYNDLWLVFEYVLPLHDPTAKKFSGEYHIRADVILVSVNTAVVLEFKQRSEDFSGLFRQAKKYQNRLTKFHVESRNMKVKSMLVLTKAKKYRKTFEGVLGCSPDTLKRGLIQMFGDKPQRKQDVMQWINSDFVGLILNPEKKKERIKETQARVFACKAYDYYYRVNRRLDTNEMKIDLLKKKLSYGKKSMNDYEKEFIALKEERKKLNYYKRALRRILGI